MNADAEAIIEQALRFVLEQQAMLLKRADSLSLKTAICELNNLATETLTTMTSGIERAKTVKHLIELATKVEATCDNLSEELWTFIPVTVCAVFQNLERALHPPDDKYGAGAELRSYYQNMRQRLLQQTLGARMLNANSDLGDEIERIWQQFLQKSLGEAVRVLRGGVIVDYQGNCSKHQIDLIVVPTEAHVTFPGASDGGKAHVPIDQVISAIMVSATLNKPKLRKDWENLADIPSYSQMVQDHPTLGAKSHPWPLRYIIGAQSDPIEVLKTTWEESVLENIGPAPEFVVTLDSGFLYSGATGWPRPCFPSNYTEAGHVWAQTGIYRGLGLAWLLVQHQGRLAVIQRRALGPITRQAASLDTASLHSSTPATYSFKFDTMLRPREIAGKFQWGNVSTFAHNHLNLSTVHGSTGRPLCLAGIDPKEAVYPNDTKGVRWFRYPLAVQAGDLLALEEWIEPKSKESHRRRIAIFNLTTEEELNGPHIEALQQVSEVKNLVG